MTGAQTKSLIVGNDLRLPKDSIERIRLLEDVDSFLMLGQQADVENPFILPAEKAETQILLDEIKEISKNDSIEISAYLTGIESISDKDSYFIQVAYMGDRENQPRLKACFDFIAHKADNGFLFSSPLVRNTKDWKIKELGHLVMHYQSDVNENMVDQYIEYLIKYDTKLGVSKKTEYYFCDDCEAMVQQLQLAGIRYHAGYNGYSWVDIAFGTDEKLIVIQSRRISRQRTIDPHDLFHYRAAVAIPKGKNHYMVCGGAYVYGGSWRISWEGIKDMFKSRMIYDENTDWLKLYFDRYNFGESQREHLLVTQFINALIIEKVEKKQGFSAVMELLASGNMYEEREKFFAILNKVAGINESNFNKKAAELIANL